MRNPLHFNSHAPRGAWHIEGVSDVIHHTNFNSHAPRGAWQGLHCLQAPAYFHFNSHAPRGAWQKQTLLKYQLRKFQLTRPAWSVTRSAAGCISGIKISTHTPRVERDAQILIKKQWIRYISTHTPRVERDNILVWNISHYLQISTHTPRVERDAAIDGALAGRIISTHPAWSVTRNIWGLAKCYNISTHTPRVERDRREVTNGNRIRSFQLTRPAWSVTGE